MPSTASSIKVDIETDRGVADAAHVLERTKNDIVDAAVREYVDAHRDQLNEGIRDSLRRIDDSAQSVVSSLTVFSAERLAELGGIPEN
jgi:hypothetical protein